MVLARESWPALFGRGVQVVRAAAGRIDGVGIISYRGRRMAARHRINRLRLRADACDGAERFRLRIRAFAAAAHTQAVVRIVDGRRRLPRVLRQRRRQRRRGRRRCADRVQAA